MSVVRREQIRVLNQNRRGLSTFQLFNFSTSQVPRILPRKLPRELGSLAAEGDGIGAVLAALERHRLHLADKREAWVPRKERRSLA